jgi:hypothetical protein
MSDPNHTPVPALRQNASRVPGVGDALWFAFRALCFRGLRFARASMDRAHRRHRVGARLCDAPILAESRATLWPANDAPERALVLGKIENLRVARRAFDGIELAPGDVLSFWAQLGRPSRGRGFVIGRELREGCLIPSIGGGLCQLSNALYDAALQGGLEIVERHAHSQVVPGSAATRDLDATVFWNYVDLRLRAPCALRVEVDLDADTLCVRLRGHRDPSQDDPSQTYMIATLSPRAATRDATTAHGDCATCGQTACFRNAPQPSDAPAANGRAVVLAGTLTPEHAEFLARTQPHAERLVARVGTGSRLRRRARTAIQRLRRWPPARRALAAAGAEAHAAAARLRPEHLDLYVDQAWLPFLWQRGVLAGRRVHVLMQALPMNRIQAELDRAARRHPDEPTLRDFRADGALVEAERRALDAATQWIGAHAQAMALAGGKGHALPWRTPPIVASKATATAPRALRVLFPASSLVRKGALELASALQGMPVELLLPMRDGGEPARWGTIPLRRVALGEDTLPQCDVVALPAWVEHQPRVLLAAIARGVPVIATAACGLGTVPGWIDVPAGDVDALRAQLQRLAAALPIDRTDTHG